MKTKINLILLGAMALSLAFSACNTQDRKVTSTEQNNSAKNIIYTCPMHAEVISDEPGKCPKCHMELVEKSQSNDSTQMNNDTTREHKH